MEENRTSLCNTARIAITKYVSFRPVSLQPSRLRKHITALSRDSFISLLFSHTYSGDNFVWVSHLRAT